MKLRGIFKVFARCLEGRLFHDWEKWSKFSTTVPLHFGWETIIRTSVYEDRTCKCCGKYQKRKLDATDKK